MKKIIKETAGWFEDKKRGENDIIILKDGAPKALCDSVHEAHGDRLPDNWIYEKYSRILDDLEGYDTETADDLEEHRAEIVDDLVDVYTSDLTAWLNSHNANVYYITEAQEEYGPETDGFKLLMTAQYKAIDEIYSEVVSYLTAQAEK